MNMGIAIEHQHGPAKRFGFLSNGTYKWIIARLMSNVSLRIPHVGLHHDGHALGTQELGCTKGEIEPT
jgi:hypothetical protein